MRTLAAASILALVLAGGLGADAQTANTQTGAGALEYLHWPVVPEPTGMAPGMKATELSPPTRIFRVSFTKGDDVEAGLTEFAAKNHIVNAHFTGIGAFDSAVLGQADPAKGSGLVKLTRLNEEMEVAAFTGSITAGTNDAQPAVHAHLVVALLRNGQVYAGHFVEGHVSITMQIYLEDSVPVAGAAPAAAAE